MTSKLDGRARAQSHSPSDQNSKRATALLKRFCVRTQMVAFDCFACACMCRYTFINSSWFGPHALHQNERFDSLFSSFVFYFQCRCFVSLGERAFTRMFAICHSLQWMQMKQEVNHFSVFQSRQFHSTLLGHRKESKVHFKCRRKSRHAREQSDTASISFSHQLNLFRVSFGIYFHFFLSFFSWPQATNIM